MTVFEIISVLLALLGLLGGAVGFIRAVAADRRSAFAAAESADARSDAAAALKQSAAATERIAAAVEIIASRQASAQGSTQASTEASAEASARSSLLARIPAELAALIGPREVEWTVERRLPAHSYRLRNMGTVPAREVSLLGGSPPANTSMARIEPGTAIIFSVDPDRHTRAVEVSWLEGTAAERGRLTLPLPSATGTPPR